MKLDTPTSGSELTAEAVAVLETGHKAIPPTFLRDLFGRVPPEDLAPYSPQTLADLAAEAFEHLKAPRTPDGADIRLFDLEIEREGRRQDVTVLEIVNDNMPFLLDSTLAEIVDEGYEPLLVAHPILAVERDASGALVRLVGEATAALRLGVKRESFIHIHLPRIDDPETRTRLIETMRLVHNDVAVAVHDWPGMRARVTEIVHNYRLNPPPLPEDEVKEAIAFLDWIARDNFTFLGLREYRLPSGDTAADPVEGSGLGLLRDPSVRVLRRGRELVAMTPEIRAFLERPQALIITKANVKSRVHRRAHLDYIGVKLFDENGRLQRRVAHRRPVHGERLYQHHRRGALPAPQGGEGHRPRRFRPVELCEPRAPQRAGELSARRAVPDRRGYALPLRHRHHEPVGASAGARARPRRRVRPLRVGSRLRAQGPLRHAGPPAHRPVPRLRSTRAACPPPIRPIRKGRSARTHYIIGRDEGQTPQVARETLEKGIAAIVRTWSDALRDALDDDRRRRTGAFARHPLCRSLQRRLSRGLRSRAGHRGHRASGAALGGAAARRRSLPPRGRRRDPREPEGVLAQRGAAALGAGAASGEPRLPRRQRANLPGRLQQHRTGCGCTT